MSKLPRISGKEIIHAFERLGFVQARQRGSHVIMVKITDTGKIGCSIPLNKIVAVGTLSGILKQANISNEEFISLF